MGDLRCRLSALASSASCDFGFLAQILGFVHFGSACFSELLTCTVARLFPGKQWLLPSHKPRRPSCMGSSGAFLSGVQEMGTSLERSAL